MGFIEPKAEIIREADLYKRIEIAARTCYKSENKICEGSAEKMVNFLMKRGHMSPLEHSDIVFETNASTALAVDNIAATYTEETALPHFVRKSFAQGSNTYIYSANLRAWLALSKFSQNWFNSTDNTPDIMVLEAPIAIPLRVCNVGKPIIVFRRWTNPSVLPFSADIEARHTIVTARFTCDRAVSHELVRHRCLSFSQLSQRYVNYKDGIDCVQPHWWYDLDGPRDMFQTVADIASDNYAHLISQGYPPQDARAILPNVTATEIVVTGTQEQWIKYVLPLRLSKAAHPDIRRLMTLFCNQLGWDPNIFTEA